MNRIDTTFEGVSGEIEVCIVRSVIELGSSTTYLQHFLFDLTVDQQLLDLPSRRN